MRSLLISILVLITGILSCKKDDSSNPSTKADPLAELNLPSTPYNYSDVSLPGHFKSNAFPQGNLPVQNAVIENDNMPADNPITDAGATLGRVLFYDKKLSIDGSVACASCHKNNVYAGTPTDCYSCHAQDDVHNGRNGTDCGRCHNTRSWGD